LKIGSRLKFKSDKILLFGVNFHRHFVFSRLVRCSHGGPLTSNGTTDPEAQNEKNSPVLVRLGGLLLIHKINQPPWHVPAAGFFACSQGEASA
jgi:hypothetical protein